MKKIETDITKSPRKIRNAEVLQLFSQWFMTPLIKDYFDNERTREVWKLKFVSTGTIEGDALALARQNGRVSYIEDLMLLMKTAYEDQIKIQSKLRKEVANAEKT